jgi:hypothetical protein
MGLPRTLGLQGLIRHEVAANPWGTGPPADWVGDEPAGMALSEVFSARVNLA